MSLTRFVLTAYGTYMFHNFYTKKNEALLRALSLSGDKGIVNLGAGCNRTGFSQSTCQLPQVIANVDFPADGFPKGVSWNLNEFPTPFSDKQFDVAFASHTLEHLIDWEKSLDEWTRIADHVVIVQPNPLAINGMLWPEHRHHFSFETLDYIREHWGVEVFA